MSNWIPLLQTIAWIGLIVWLVTRYNQQLKQLVSAIEERIVAGSSVKAGPFEIGIRPQSRTEQIEQLQIESPKSEVSRDHPKSTRAASSDDIDLTGKSRALIAEDLVLRILQDEYGALINRQVTAGGGLRFDGFFVSNQVPYGIEIKFLRDYMPLDGLPNKIAQIQDHVKRLGWRRFTLIVVLIIDDDHPLDHDKLNALCKEIREKSPETVIRVFPFSEVVGHFGIDLFEREE